MTRPTKGQRDARSPLTADEEEDRRMALVDRLVVKAAEADDPRNWISLSGLTDEEIIEALITGTRPSKAV